MTTAAITTLGSAIERGLIKANKPILFIGDLEPDVIRNNISASFSSINIQATDLEEDCEELNYALESSTSNKIVFLYGVDSIDDPEIATKVVDKLSNGIPENTVLVMTAQDLNNVQLGLALFGVIIV